MENDVEIMAASPLWDTVATNDIPPEYRLLAILGVISPHIESAPCSHTILLLWLKGIPIIVDYSNPIDDGPEDPFPLDMAATAA
jgi:hypothetical protein